MNINLFDYQQEAIDNIKELYKTKRLASVILPTGGGKSFVAMQSILEIIKIEDEIKNGVVSKTPIAYFAPNIAILDQFKLHMAQNVLLETYINKAKKETIGINTEITEDMAGEILESVMSSFGLKKGTYIQDIEDIKRLSPEDYVRKTIRKTVANCKPEQLDKIISKAFPNMLMRCYQALESKKNLTDNSKRKEKGDAYKTVYVEDIDAEFVIIDEAHRTGAETWQDVLKEFADNPKHKETKYLAITATPERDNDDENFIRSLALKCGYNDDEANHNKFYAKELYLLDAMREGLVVTPRVAYFPFLLDETKEYLEVIKKYIDALKKFKNNTNQASLSLVGTYETLLKEMHRLMGMDPKISEELLKFGDLSEIDTKKIKTIKDLHNREAWENVKQQKTLEVIQESGYNPDGKYISFVPSAGKGKTAHDVFEKFKKKILKIFNVNENDLSINPYNYINSDKENRRILQEFSGADSKSGGLKIICTNQKANEGFHPDGISGEFIFETISNEKSSKKVKGLEEENPRLTFLQKIGRVVFGIQGKNKDEYEIPIIFDFQNNFGRQKDGLIVDGENLFRIPSSIQAFFELAKIASRSPKVVDSIESPKGNAFIFYSTATGKNPIRYTCPNLDENEVIIEKSLKKKEQNKKFEIKQADQKFKLLKSVLSQLQQIGIDYTQIKNDTILNDEFFKSKGISEEVIKKFYNEIINLGFSRIDEAEYDLGKDLEIFRKAFWGIGESQKYSNVFNNDDINFEELARLGIMYVDLNNIPKELKGKVREDGFIIVNNEVPENAIGLNINTGTRFYNGRDEYGCDENGRDEYGYDRYGFDKNGYHKITRQKYDTRYFYKDKDGRWINKYTQNELDYFGYNHDGINPETGFDRGEKHGDFILHLWHKKNDDGTFSRVGSEFTEGDEEVPPHDFHFFGKKGKIIDRGIPYYLDAGSKLYNGSFYQNGRNNKTDEYYSNSGLNIDGVDPRGFYCSGKEKYYNIYTSSQFDRAGKKYDGRYPAFVQSTIIILKWILAGKNIEQIYDEIEKKGRKPEDIDKWISNAYSHFLMYEGPMKNDEEIMQLYNRVLKCGEEKINMIAQLSPSFKRKYEIVTDMKNRELKTRQKNDPTLVLNENQELFEHS